MQLLRKVKVITEITKEYKEKFKKDMDLAIEDLKKVVATVDKELKKLSKPKNQEEMIKYNSLLGYKQQQLAQIENLKERKKRVLSLKEGEELLEVTLDSLVEVKVGDNLYEKLKEAYIKVKDGKIVELQD